MPDQIKPKILKGFRDFLPEKEEKKRKIQNILEKIFSRYGFVPIDTPILEYSEVLLGKGGGETDKQVYRFSDQGNRDVAMRFDLTVPFARYIAMHRNELYLPFKRYHIAKVWRGENTQKGRYREFTQCDFDIVGTDSASADFDILLLMKKSIEAIGVKNFTIQLSHRGVFNDLLNSLSCGEQSVSILRTVDKLSKIGREQVADLLQDICGSEKCGAILSFIQPEKTFQETIAKMRALTGGNSPGIERLSEIHSYMQETGTEKTFMLNPSITRGLDYYTGVVFETFLNDAKKIGSVCSGGRYNNLASLYTSETIPGVGASIGLDRLLAGLEMTGEEKKSEIFTDIIIFCFDPKFNGFYHRLCEELRDNGFRCEVFPENKKLGQQFSFAEKKNIPLAVICGEDEMAKQSVSLKDLRTRENYQDLSGSELMKKAAALLSTPSDAENR